MVAETGGVPSLAGVWELNSCFLCNFSVSVLLLLYSTDPCIGTLGHFPISGVVPHQFLIFTDLTTSHNLCTDSSRHESWHVCHRLARAILPEGAGRVPGSGSAILTSLSAARASGVPCMAVPCFRECCQPSMSPLPHGHAGSSSLSGRGGRCSTCPRIHQSRRLTRPAGRAPISHSCSSQPLLCSPLTRCFQLPPQEGQP